MDYETQRKMWNIGKSIPKELMRGAIKREETGKQTSKAIEKYLRNPNLTIEQAKKFEKLTAGIDKKTTHDVIDKEKVRKIHEHVDGQVKRAISRGEIKPAQKDSFFRMLQNNLKKHG
jgi:hypothetical protein